MNQGRQTLSVEDLDLRRGGRELFAGLSFELGQGEAALVTGPNGSGKTSLLRTLAGLAPAERGVAYWEGSNVYGLPWDKRADIAYRGHLEGLKKDLTVLENLKFYASTWGREQAEPGLLDEVGLGDYAGARVRTLSAGQKRRIALASLRACGARLWILDEPMTNLDPPGRQLIVRWLQVHLAAGGIAVIASHVAEDLASHMTVSIEL